MNNDSKQNIVNNINDLGNIPRKRKRNFDEEEEEQKECSNILIFSVLLQELKICEKIIGIYIPNSHNSPPLTGENASK